MRSLFGFAVLSLTILLVQFATTAQAQYNVSAPVASCPLPLGTGDLPFLAMCPDGIRFVIVYRSSGQQHVTYSLYNGVSSPVVENVDLGFVGAARAVAVNANRVALFARKPSTSGSVTYVNCDDGTNTGENGTLPFLDNSAWQQKLFYVPSEGKVLIPSWNTAAIYDVVNNTFVSYVSGAYVRAALPMGNGKFITIRQAHPAFGGQVFLAAFTYAGVQIGSELTLTDGSYEAGYVELLNNGNFIIMNMRNSGLVIRVYNGTTYSLVGEVLNALPSNGGVPRTYEKLADGKVVIIMSSEYNQMVVLEADGLSVYAVYSYTTGNTPVIRRDALGMIQVQTQFANSTVQRLRFDMSGSYRCNTGGDCSCASGACGLNTCVNQVCGVGFRPSSFLCRASNPLVACDPEEYCTGTSNQCPADVQTGGASSCEDVNSDPVCSDDGSVGTVFHLKCEFAYNEGRGLVLSAEGLVGSTIGAVGRVAFPQGQSGCPRPSLTATPQGSSTPWTFTYNPETCKYTAHMTIAPNSIPSNWLFSNGSNAIAVGSDSTYNLITVPVNVATTTLIGATEHTIDNHLYSYTLRLPRMQNTSTTRYALKMFKLSDNNRGGVVVGQPGEGFAFSAILMGGLTSGPNRHVINGTPTFIPDPSSPSLSCTVESEIYVYCGPFVDTNAATPVAISGVLQVNARCLDVDCIPRLLYLPVTFLAGDYETTLDGSWSALTPLIWRRLENNDALDVELTNDVIVGGDKLVLSLNFDAGSLTTLTKLFVTVSGFSGAGATLVEYSSSVFVVHDTTPSSPVSDASTIIKNQAQQAEIDSFFRFPSSYGINFAVQWDWPSALPTDFRGTFHVDSFFDITYSVRRRQDGGSDNRLVLIKGPQGAVGGEANGEQVILIVDGASDVRGSILAACATMIAALLLP